MPKIVDHERYRKELLNKSFDLFAEKGYSAITMRQVAEGLSVSTGTLYHYFPSKQALFEQLVSEIVERDLIRVAAQLKDAQTLQERIEISFEYLSKHQDYLFKQALIYADFYKQQQREGQKTSDFLLQVYEKVERAIAELLGIEDPQMTTFLLSLVDGFIWQQVYGMGCVDYDAQAKLLSKMLNAYFESTGVGEKNKTPFLPRTAN